ncbi:hypothetical protein D3C80_1408610 [compost metagenome]
MAAGIDAATGAIADLGGDHQVLAAGQALDDAPHHFLADTGRIEVGQVDEVHPLVQGVGDDRLALFLIEDPRLPVRGAHVHGAQAQAGDLQAGVAQTDVLHGANLRL